MGLLVCVLLHTGWVRVLRFQPQLRFWQSNAARRESVEHAGMTVHIGARVSALAGAGEVKVSSTVRDLVIGADLEFADQQTVGLKGVPGEWTILRVA